MDNVYSTVDIVSAIMTGDNSRAKEGTLSVLSQKSMDELEVRKAEIAQNLFKDAPTEEVSDVQEPEETSSVEEPETNSKMEVSDPATGGDIQVVDPFDGQPKETLNEPNSEIG
jgi:hypothetical protein